VLYRFQVLKQADVVLALFLQGDRFTLEEKRADFEYYDPVTTGDSTLSAVVQSVMAAEVGYHEAALHYFHQALYVDLMNLHENTVDGLHIASAGGVWACLVAGFGGMRDHNGVLSFDPRLPASWPGLRFRLLWRGSRVQAELTDTRMVFTLLEGGEPEVPIVVRGTRYAITEGSPVVVELPDQGARLPSHLGDHPLIGGRRADGTTITADVPEPIHPPDQAAQTGEFPEFVPEGPVAPPQHHES
jgi:alpha,alpha-trehalose phosphorylase